MSARMATHALDVIGTQRDEVGESPLWSVDEQALYWVDIGGHQLRRYDWTSREVRSWTTPGPLASIALHVDGGLVGAIDNRIVHLRLRGDALQLRVMYTVQFPEPGMRFNDGRCDRSGRFWVTSMQSDTSRASPVGSLYRIDHRGVCDMSSGLITGNGLAVSPDNRRLYLSDSHPLVRRVWHFDLQTDGALANRQEFIHMNAPAGRPDGAAVDADGGYWICANDGGVVQRYTSEGWLDHTLPLPVAKPGMCAFGGPDLGHLFITSIRPTSPQGGTDAALDGALFIARPGATGLPETPYNPTPGDAP